MNLYIIIKNLLIEDKKFRNSDNEMFWRVLEDLGRIHNGILLKEDFMKAPSYESCSRCRRKIQENFPELQATESVRRAREEKENEKGTFVYREQVKPKQLGPKGHFEIRNGMEIFIKE